MGAIVTGLPPIGPRPRRRLWELVGGPYDGDRVETEELAEVNSRVREQGGKYYLMETGVAEWFRFPVGRRG